MHLHQAIVKSVAPTLLLALASGAAAQTYVWNGSSGTDWNTTNTNWSGSTWVSSDTAVAQLPGGITGLIWLRETVTLNDVECIGAWTIMPGGGSLTLAGAGSVVNVIPGATLNLKAPVVGSVGLTKTGGGHLSLMQPCTYDGPTVVSGGILSIAQSGSLPANSELSVGAGVVVSCTQGFNNISIYALSGAGTFNSDGLHLPVITLQGTTANPVSTAGFRDSTMRIVKSGSGLQTLAGPSTYPLGTTINGGVLIAGSNAAFGTGDVTVNAGTWGLRGNITQANGGSISGAGAPGYPGAIHNIADNNFVTGTISASGDFTIGASSGSITLTNAVSTGPYFATVNPAAGAVVSVPTFNTLPVLTKNGLGELRLTGASGLTNGITINAGRVTFDHDSALNDAVVVMATGGTGLRINGHQASVRGLANGDSVAFVDNGHTTPGVLTISPFFGSWTFNGLLLDGVSSGSLGVTKLGGGEQIFATNQGYSGPTTVTAGTLTFNGTLTQSPVTINGGTLGGNGSINSTVTISNGVLTGARSIGGLLTVSGGTVKPAGAAQGALTLNSGLAATGGTFEMQGPAPISGHDQIVVTGGDVSLGNGVTALAYSTSGAVSYGPTDRIVVISNTGSGTTSGYFAGLSEGTEVASLAGFGGQARWKISYHFDLATGNSTGGNDVVLRPAAPSGIVNGGFETGSGPLGLAAIGSTAIQGWTVTRGNIEWLDTATWAAPEGSHSLDLNGVNSAGGVKQTVNLPGGVRYRMMFTMAANPDGGPAVKHMDVRVNSTVLPYSFDTTGRTRADMGWMERSMVLVGTGDNMEIEFFSSDAPSNFGVALDNVRLVAEPCASDVAGLGTSPGGDGQVTVDDIVFFLSHFFADDRDRCDLVAMGGAVGSDGQVTVDDLVAFLQGFFSGCP